MKRASRISLWVGIAALSLAPWATAQSVTLTSAGNNVADGVYVSPYYATVNGVSNTPIVCDDFKDDSYLNKTWNSTSISFSSLSSSNLPTAWGNALGTSGSTFKLYEEAAWLTLSLLKQLPGTTGQIDYSYAVWAVFDPSGVASWLNSYGDTSTYNAIFGAGGLLAQAQNQSYSTGEFSNVVVLTPLVSKGAGTTTCTAGACPEQEFFEAVPEGGAAMAYLLLAGLGCFGAMFLRSRCQIRGISAT